MLRRFFLRLSAFIAALCAVFIGVTLASAQFIPRGPELAFSTEVDGRSSIHLLSLRHGLSYPLTNIDAPHRSPVWSPDGSMLIYESRRRNNYNLYVTDLEDPLYNEHRLTATISGDSNATWLGEPQEAILYVSSPGVTNRIYRMNVDANPFEHDRITDIEYSSYAPSISPSTGDILYVSIRNGGQYDIFLFDQRTGIEHNLTNDPYIDSTPRWSPQGDRFVFQSYRGDSLDLFLADASGRNIRQLTNERGGDHSAMWSPDGRFIAFTSNRDGNDEIYVMEVDHPENLRRITTHLAADRTPVWSPDGNTLAFVSYRDNNAEIYLANLLRGTIRRLTYDPGQDNFPAWRP